MLLTRILDILDTNLWSKSWTYRLRLIGFPSIQDLEDSSWKSLENKFTKNRMQHMRRHAKRWIGSTFEGHPETAIAGVTSQLPAAANQKSAAASAITCQQAWSELTVSTEDSNTQCRWLPSNFTCISWQTVNKQARNQVSLLVDKHRMWEDQALTYAQIAFSKSSLETALPHRCATSWPEDSTKFYVCSALPYNLRGPDNEDLGKKQQPNHLDTTKIKELLPSSPLHESAISADNQDCLRLIIDFLQRRPHLTPARKKLRNDSYSKDETEILKTLYEDKRYYTGDLIQSPPQKCAW